MGSFIIFNTFSIIVTQRTRELALLRALGASRRQVCRSVVVEAFAVGVIASVVGIVAGIGIAIGLKGLLGVFDIDLPSTSLQLLPRTIIVSLLVGVIVTVVASILPARRAGSVAPIEALREAADATATRELAGRRLAIAVGVTALGAARCSTGSSAPNERRIDRGTRSRGDVHRGGDAVAAGGEARRGWIGRTSAEALDAGAARARERDAQPAAHRLDRGGADDRARPRVDGRDPRRVAEGLVRHGAQRDPQGRFTLSTSSFTSFCPQVAERVAALPEVGTVSTFRQNGFRVNGSTSFVTAVDPSTIEEVATLEVSEGSVGALAEGTDTVLVHRDEAADNGWKVGDEVPSEFAASGEVPLTIVGIYDENRLVGDYVISLDTYDGLFSEQLDSFVLVKAAEGVPLDDVGTAIEGAVKEYSNVQVQDQAAFREQQAGFVDQLLGLVTALLAMAIIIALFGIVNTLGLSIYERTRELGLLRAVGMSRMQVKRMIRWEAVIIAVLGAVLGVVIGILFGWAMQQALKNRRASRARGSRSASSSSSWCSPGSPAWSPRSGRRAAPRS